jgi:hypothetical protein
MLHAINFEMQKCRNQTLNLNTTNLAGKPAAPSLLNPNGMG